MGHEEIVLVIAGSFAIQALALAWIIWVARDIHRTSKAIAGLVLQETKKILTRSARREH